MPSSQTTTDSIARSAARLRIRVLVVVVVMVLLYVAARLNLSLGAARVEYRVNGPDVSSSRTVGDVTVLLLVVAFFRLSQMLAKIASGQLFSAEVVGRFRSFAFWLLVTALFSLVAPTAVQLLNITSAGHHRIEVTLDFREVLTVAVTLVLFLLARLLERARSLDEEVQEFV